MEYFVDQNHDGADDRNSGAEHSPFLTIQAAVDAAFPGDTIFVKSGTYDSVWIEKSGTTDAPITLKVHPNHLGQVIVDGGGAQINKSHGAIHIESASHIVVDGFEVTNSHFGIALRGDGYTEISDVRIYNNFVHNVDNAGIWVAGQLMHKDTTVDSFTISNVIILGNQVTQTNLGQVSLGANEAITIAGGVDGFQVIGNWVYDSNQYGIDAKTNAKNGVISNNIIHDIEMYGIYVDSNSRTASNIEISKNLLFSNDLGIVLAREASDGLISGVSYGFGEHEDDFKDGHYKPNLSHIDVKDNLILFSEKSGLFLDLHNTKDLGGGKFDEIEIDGNVIAGSGHNGFRIDPNLDGTLTNAEVVNNTIFASSRQDVVIPQSSEITMNANSFEALDLDALIERYLTALDNPFVRNGRLEKNGSMDNDVVNGTKINDAVYGFGGSDILYGHGGNDFISGMRGNDTMHGGAGDDRMNGLEDNDVLFGQAGNDILRGWTGNDFLDGGAGADSLFGGAGKDTFVFNAASGNDRVHDFEAGLDLIDLKQMNLNTFADVQERLSDTTEGVVIDLGANASILLNDVVVTDLTIVDFAF